MSGDHSDKQKEILAHVIILNTRHQNAGSFDIRWRGHISEKMVEYIFLVRALVLLEGGRFRSVLTGYPSYENRNMHPQTLIFRSVCVHGLLLQDGKEEDGTGTVVEPIRDVQNLQEALNNARGKLFITVQRVHPTGRVAADSEIRREPKPDEETKRHILQRHRDEEGTLITDANKYIKSLLREGVLMLLHEAVRQHQLGSSSSSTHENAGSVHRPQDTWEEDSSQSYMETSKPSPGTKNNNVAYIWAIKGILTNAQTTNLLREKIDGLSSMLSYFVTLVGEDEKGILQLAADGVKLLDEGVPGKICLRRVERQAPPDWMARSTLEPPTFPMVGHLAQSISDAKAPRNREESQVPTYAERRASLQNITKKMENSMVTKMKKKTERALQRQKASKFKDEDEVRDVSPDGHWYSDIG